MAKLHKLHLCGVRSFGPYEEHIQQLKFTSPVTLILGQNGCGKTTIIEAIKYACTGELPGGTNRGEGFINDPKMTNSVGTKGQIKLKFFDTKGNEVTVSRVMELSQATKGNMKFGSKSVSIRTVDSDGNEIGAGSGRCVDITVECCEKMNVSPSVLNNVIFCHQENAAWPLDEGKKLMEKFDEIFDAEKYNRLIDILRKQLKDKKIELKTFQLELKYAQEKKDNVEKLRNTLNYKKRTEKNLQLDIQKQLEKVEPMKKRIQEILELEETLGELQRQLTMKTATKNGVAEEQNTIKRGIKFVFEGSDEELRKKIESFQADRDRDKNLIVEMDRRKTELENKAQMITNAINRTQADLGKFREQKSNHQKRGKERTTLLQQGSEKLGVDSFVKDLENDENAKSAIGDLKIALQSSELELKALISDKDDVEIKLQKKIDQVREQLVTVKQSKVSKEEQIVEGEKKIAKVKNELDDLSSADECLRNNQRKIETIEKTINSLNNAFRVDEESQITANYKKNIEDLQRILENLDSEYRILQQNDVIEGKLESEERLIMDKQKEINRIKNKHFSSLQQLFGNDLPERNFSDAVRTLQTTSDSLITKLTELKSKKQKEVTTLQVQHQNQEEKIAIYEKDLCQKQEQIEKACNGRNFDETLDASFMKKERLQRDKGQYSSIKIIFEEFLKEFQKESPCCPVCDTNFTAKTSAVKTIVTGIKRKLGKVPQQLVSVEEELQKEESTYAKLQQLKFVNDELNTLKVETIPELKQQLNDILHKLKSAETELTSISRKLEEPQKIVEIAKIVISDLSSLDQHLCDIEKSKQNVEKLKRELIQVPSNKSKQEVEAHIDRTREEIDELHGKIDAQMKKINNHKDRLQQFANDKNVIIENQMKLRQNVQSKPALEAQLTEIWGNVEKLKEEVRNLAITVNNLKSELQIVEEEKEQKILEYKQKIEKFREKLDSNREIVQNLEKIQRDIDEYLENKIEEQLQTLQETLKELQSKEAILGETKRKIIDAIGMKKEELAQEELQFHTLQNNVILREKRALELTLDKEINALKENIGGYNYKTVYEEKRKLTASRENLDKAINTLQGQLDALIGNIQEIEQELEERANKNAFDDYMTKFYKLRIAENLIQDINNYTTALEKAVLDFHKSKMIQINKNIRELWREIYKGNDIDYIEIKTEYVATKSAKRSYNYKVVQVKKGVELDMRGRCSAGQKVLACLIIRIALAETLSSNCGILALDEPTTNVDKENVQSLCDALSRIITMRQQDKNFQLIVITHDAEFLNVLRQIQGVPHYYRVSRDNDGFSIIRKEYNL